LLNKKNGTFYFIENFNQLDEFFVNCLGSILSCVGKNANIKRFSLPNEIFGKNKVFFNRGLGGGKIWSKNEDNSVYTTNVPYIIAGQTKDFLLEIKLPKAVLIMENSKIINIVKVVFSAESVSNSVKNKNISKEFFLDIKVFTENLINEKEEEIVDNDVIFNFLRLKLVDTMGKAKALALNGNFKEASKILFALGNEIASSPIYQKHEKMSLLYEEIKQAIKDVEPQAFKGSGSHSITNNIICNLHQSSAPNNVNFNQYSNKIQQNFSKQIKANKNSKNVTSDKINIQVKNNKNNNISNSNFNKIKK